MTRSDGSITQSAGSASAFEATAIAATDANPTTQVRPHLLNGETRAAGPARNFVMVAFLSGGCRGEC
ncbi:MAG: hypothetical protein P4L98_02615 [Ancalomicrobiaceae bacterium]|nr:hypothetical protein [Ancalomicrobiaceae bacterium]